MAQATTTAKRPQKRGQPQKREQKRDQQRNWAHGNFHWNELRTRDAERAKRFYAETIGWTFEAMATPDGHTYWVAMQDGKPVAGLFPLTSPQFDEVPESWMSFLAVDDVDKPRRQGGRGRRQARHADLRRPRCRPHRHAARARRRGHRLDDAGR